VTLRPSRSFYRDTLGFPATLDSPWWVELSAGAAGLALHPRMDSGAEAHHANDVTLGLAIPDLEEWYEEAKERGLPFSGPPHDRGFGIFADATDPDGNQITFRNLPMGESLEEELAEPFEDDVTPQRVAMRKPVRKGVKATSRVATRPDYHEPRTAAKPRRTPKSDARVASPRGTGPAGSRQKPKVKHDPKRARTKPAIGRLRKAERRTLESKKVAVAGVSKSKPVKRASRPRATKRTTARARSSR
jgi:catechol 2,3-dioxygenase-like lactoylglutathione lyase family enzyme